MQIHFSKGLLNPQAHNRENGEKGEQKFAKHISKPRTNLICLIFSIPTNFYVCASYIHWGERKKGQNEMAKALRNNAPSAFTTFCHCFVAVIAS
jgi:hypothetical protein